MVPGVAVVLLLALVLAPASGVAGVVRGTVRVPAVAQPPPPEDPYPGRAGSIPRVRRTVRGLVTDAVLFVAELPASADSSLRAPVRGARLAQSDQSFVPRVLPISAGSTVDFPNEDPVYHNVFSVCPLKRFDLGKYGRGKSKQVTFRRAGVVPVYCDIHSNMAAFIVVAPSRAFAQPDSSGGYALPELPAGHYLLKVWHPDFDELTRAVSVPDSGEVRLDVSF